ncbi:hypothetical protein [Methylobacterium sp. J-077]|uniref:hypothetical protein n=1 Tax=Methylobacterium sp. J-077 TaxID=2836656 RepID=UPI001FB89C41|nr:hypothetical protein [Methylobacterium sp. J-077]MCJ2127024.1 hypothetical protein [Methylobacterium sp. J-077]
MVFSKVAGTIAAMMEMMVEEPISARDPEGVGERRQASPRAGRSEADTGTAPEGVEPV